ncbi:MAG: hypothetical protein R3C10_17545 [Pirellulales bacterium]
MNDQSAPAAVNTANDRMSLQRRLFCVALALVVATAGIAGVLRYHHVRYRHFAVHEPGKVYRSAWVDDDVFEELIRKYHIRTVVNLCSPGEMGDRSVGQRQAVKHAGARLIELPFPPNNTWDTDWPAVAEMEEILDDPTSYPIWIHCQHGRERTVKALSIYDIRRRGMTAQESLKRMPLFGMDHPWPIVTFAHNYEEEQTCHDGSTCIPHVAESHRPERTRTK